MPDFFEQVLIEFVSDTTQLQPGVDKLEQLGEIDAASSVIFKKTNDQLKTRNMLLAAGLADSKNLTLSITAQQTQYNKLVASVKNLSGESKLAVQSMLNLSPERLAAGFEKMGLSIDDYVTSLEAAEPATQAVSQASTTLRTQLTELTNALAEMTAAGQTNTEEFNTIATEAGRLKNALQGTKQTVANLGSDVPTLKIFAAAASGITGAFTAATGAAALFGDENKDLQEVLIKVNAVMAINQGISQALNIVRDEAAISTARILIQEKVLNAQLAIENGLQSESVIVRGAATVAQLALNAAQALSPVGIVTGLIAALVIGIVAYASSAREAKQAQEDFNQALEGTKTLLDANIRSIQRTGEEQLAALDDIGARESAKKRAQANILVQIAKEQQKRLDEINALIFANEGIHNEEAVKRVADATKEKEKLEADLSDTRSKLFEKNLDGQKKVLVEELEAFKNNADAKLNLQVKNSNAFFAAQRTLANAEAALELQQAGQDEEKKFSIRAALQRKFIDIQIAQDAVAQKQIASANESAIIKAQNESRAINDRLSQEEVDAQNKSILDQAAFDIRQEGLKANEIKAIRDKANQQVVENNRKFRQQEIIESLQDQQSKDAVILSDVQNSEKDQLNARIDSIFAAAAIEIEQNKGKIEKIKEIEAKRDADVSATRLASIQKELEQELAFEAAKTAARQRNIEFQLSAQDKINSAQTAGQQKFIEKTLGVQKLSLGEQFSLIDQLTAHDLDANQKKQDSLKKRLATGALAQKDFAVQNAQLTDESVKITEDGEKKKQDAILKTAETQRAQNQAILKITLDAASKTADIFGEIFQAQDDAAQHSIDKQRERINALEKAGDISTKEAMARNTALDLQEKKLQREKAKRDKALAIFKAVIATATAVVEALTAGPVVGIVLAAVTAALGAAEIAVIAARPIPQFKKGKKNRYEGPGIIGEAGAELHERNGKLYVATKPTITWLGSSDKVYNPKETARMMGSMVPANRMPVTVYGNHNHTNFDYDKMGQAVGANVEQSGINLDKKGFTEWLKKGNSLTTYLNDRRRWK